VCGRGRHGADRYGCSLHHQRGDGVCSNALLVRRDDLEERLLQRLSDAVLREEVSDYAVAGLKDEMEKRFETLNTELEQTRQRKRRIEGELSRLVRAIADGQPSKSPMSAIGTREEELRFTDRLLEPGAESLSSKLEELKTFAVSRLTNLRKLISHPESVDQARAALAEYFGRFTLDPTNEAGEASYSVRGEVDFFGGQALARTGGAGGWHARCCHGRISGLRRLQPLDGTAPTANGLRFGDREMHAL
jgi:site-specific DNA recombinase